jgi:myo-inositol-1(or 4)-monophosphatase
MRNQDDQGTRAEAVPSVQTADEDQRFTFATEVIAEAGAVALEHFSRLATLTVSSKGVQDLVSEADVAVEKLIKRRLAEAYPADAFLGEETGYATFPDSSGIWVVDPIDGTQPFVSGLTTWCISMAYVRDGAVLFGLVLNPAADELFTGGVGRPAQLNGRPIAVRPGADLTAGLVYLGCSPRVRAEQVVPVLDRLLRNGGMYVRNGSGALGLCDVACGRLLGYVEPHINSWDCLGAIGVLQAAGARVSDFLAADGLLRGNPIVAGAPAVYDQLVAVLGAPDLVP